MSYIKSAQCMTDKILKTINLAQVLGSDNAERPPESRCCVGMGLFIMRAVCVIGGGIATTYATT